MKKAMTNMLNLQGWIVYKVETKSDEVEIYVGRPKKEACCPHCGGLTRRVHSRSQTWRKVVHGTVMGRKAYLRLRPRRFYCGACQRTFRERFPGLEKWSRQTIQGEQEILSHLEGSSIHQAGKRSGVGDWVVRRVLKRRVKGEIPIEEALLGLSEIVLGI